MNFFGQRSEQRTFRSFLLIALAIYCVLAFVHIFWGRITGDEGFFALSVQNVMRGMRPYRDFMFLQMPLVPYVYVPWFTLFGGSIESGRIFSAILGVVSLALVSGASFRRGGAVAGIGAAFLCAGNLDFTFETGTLKTQPLTVFLTACAIFVLAKQDPRKPLAQTVLASLFMSLAFLTRLSMLPALLLLWAYAAWQLRKRRIAFVWLLATNIITLLAVLACFCSAGNMLFGIYTFHHEYFGFPPWDWDRLVITIHEWIANQLPIIFLFVVAAGMFVLKWSHRETGFPMDFGMFSGWMLISYWSVTAVHWINVQNYSTHQTSITAFAVVFSTIILAGPINAAIRGWHSLVVVAFAALLLLPMPLQQWAVHFDGRGGPKKIREALFLLHQYANRDDYILTFSAELAVNGHFRVPEGYELSEFSYFPRMNEERRAKLKVINFPKLVSDISSRRYRVLCMSDRGFFVIRSLGGNDDAAKLTNLIDLNYNHVGVVEDYGQFYGRLHVFAVKNVTE
jgi:hypothetical protein